MHLLDLAALLLTLAALFGYVNHRFIGLPTTIGIMVISMGLSLIMVLLGKLGVPAASEAALGLLRDIDFDEALMQGMLSFLLFAGALHVDLQELSRHKGIIITLATGGVVFTTFAVGSLSWLLFGMLGLPLDYGYCLLFGALIAPTDPVAVLSMRRFRDFSPGAIRVLTWGGLRGGISVALALSLPGGEARDILVTVAYVVVVFSIVVQGLTIKRVVASARESANVPA